MDNTSKSADTPITAPPGKQDDAAPANPLARTSHTSITLSEPIVRGETTIDTLNLRKPKAGELRQLSLGDVVNTEVTAILSLIPRISEPPLTPDEVNNLDPADLMEIGGAIRGFFMTAAERRMMETMLAQQQPTS